MSHRLSKAYKAFTSREWPAPAPASGGGAAFPPRRFPASSTSAWVGPETTFLAGLCDNNLTILIRALLDAQAPSASGVRAALPAPDAAAPEDGLSAGPAAFAMARERLEAVREEAAAKFLEYRERWAKRLAFIQLHPFLKRNQWFVEAPEGWALAGKGTRKDAKMLYLQSLHDMASDGERQVSLLSGAVFRQEQEVAALWHEESVRDNRSKLLPALEATLRAGESAVFKKLRLALGDLAQETFTERVNKWDRRFFHSEEDLFREAAWPWLTPRVRSGFEGFMETYADLCEALTTAIVDHYEAKWDLYLRGLAPRPDERMMPT